MVLFGSGALGRTLLRGLREEGIAVAAFSDNDARRWNSDVDGVPVYSPADVSARFGTRAAFFISVWNAGRRRNQTAIREQLAALGCREIFSFVELARCFPARFLPYFAIDRHDAPLAAADEIDAAYELLAGERSRAIFCEQLEWRITADYARLGSPGDEPQYFPPDVYRLREDERFVDCGAYDGDTLQQFLALTRGAFDAYRALEPDPANFGRLRAAVESLPAAAGRKITCLPLAASDHRGTEQFDSRGSGSSTVSSAGETVIECAPLDDVIDSCTLIKLDVEGAEPRVLRGAQRLIRDHAPLLAVSAYHTQSHLWELPLLVHAMNGTYALSYREHNEEGFDVVLYAVPRGRA